MSPSTHFVIALVTAPDLDTARRLAQAALDAHLVACVNLVPRLESHYWWEGKIECSAEVLMLCKTTPMHAPALEKLIVAEHPYDTPEFVWLNVDGGNAKYLNWWLASTGPNEPL